VDTDSATFSIVVLKSAAIRGKAGKYMSIEKGVMALSAPSIRMRKKFCCLLRCNKAMNNFWQK
jgi:hypothetical protein